ncbi:MAG: GNAT family N-acetyltransferase, partial [Anaerovoracaceae bacterium]
DYVEGTKTSPVGYLEGIFVRENCRGRGYGAELLAECVKWARANGCREFASDCEIDNLDSLRFHMAMKFSEANRIICFSKKL